MIQEGSKTPLIIGIVLAVLCGLACFIGGAFMLFGVRRAAPAAVTVSVPVTAPALPQLTVALLPDGGVFVEDVRIPPEDLGDALEASFRTSGDARVVIAADRSLSHQQVVGVIELAKKAGFTKVALAVSASPDGG